ncbi:hypothetical protein [Pelagicoccus albus]|uniref:Uncharacterized protein n=1 Tax=Pelagicoccus albus TaxID=415222 RepID=A0A7X1E6T6_9BACT|nr:hypothetical protein [Pelagicoccus albus]MBC2604476.1 hypothetical protein [Pelagicoccus albus]
MVRGLTTLLALSIAGIVYGQTDFNPFLTPAADPNANKETPPPVTTLDSFQFNGIMRMGGTVRISVFDAKENRNYWLSEGEMNDVGIEFRRLDEKNETVVISKGSEKKKLSLNKVKIEPLKLTGNATPATQPASTRMVSNRPQGPAKVESDEEARARIQRVAEEIRRRRAERRQKLENGGDK